MQFFTKAFFSAPTSFLDFASLRQAVRLACLAAASPAAGSPADAVAAGAAAVGARAGASDGCRGNSSSSLEQAEAQTGGDDSQAMGSARIHEGLRIASMDKRTNEARMKLA